MSFSVGDVVEYSDLSAWEPAVITVAHIDGTFDLEFLDHDVLKDVYPESFKKVSWDTIQQLDNQREECVREIQTLRQSNGHLQARVERYKNAWLQSQSRLASYTTTQA